MAESLRPGRRNPYQRTEPSCQGINVLPVPHQVGTGAPRGCPMRDSKHRERVAALQNLEEYRIAGVLIRLYLEVVAIIRTGRAPARRRSSGNPWSRAGVGARFYRARS